jgi:hypothetical protein
VIKERFVRSLNTFVAATVTTSAAACAAACLLLAPRAANGAPAAPAGPKPFSFAVVANSFRNGADGVALTRAIEETDDDNLAFVVVNGIKSPDEPCSDELYGQRREMLNGAKNGLVLSLAGSDWIRCRHANGRSAAIDRLNRLREMFYTGEMSLGGSRIPLQRQSLTPKFRAYGENARWEFERIMFATINLPAENNHFLPDAGRNSEFEDRLIANNDWLQRLFQQAGRKKFAGIVLFCDGDPLAVAPRAGPRRDGFTEIRQKLLELTSRFPGKVLVIHSGAQAQSTSPPAIAWRKNLGTYPVHSGWSGFTVDPAASMPFSVRGVAPAAGNQRP